MSFNDGIWGGGGAAIAMTYLILIINLSVKKLQVMVIFLPELSSFDSPYIGKVETNDIGTCNSQCKKGRA